MRKIALGIIAVFIVQVGFQFYTVVERTNTSYPQVAAAVPAWEMSRQMPDVETAYVESSRASIPAREVPETRLNMDRHSESATHTSPKPLIAKKPLFLPVIITIPQPTRYETAAYKPDKYDIPAPKPAKPAPAAREKRSLSSKALSVAKKPYDLLKFVASKLM
jgi:hypothetical protein